MATWPTSLPLPTVAGYSLEPLDQTIRTDMEVGAARVRRRTVAQLDMIDVRWVFTLAQMAAFRAWHEDGPAGAAGGAAWFTIGLQTGDGGVASREARFVNAFRASLVSATVWELTARLEVRNA